jgi:transcription elongation factor Elf1
MPIGDIEPAGKNNGASNMPLSFATPTEIVELPSRGKYYPPGHALHNTDNVEIKFMTAKEEDILSSRSLIREGVVLDRLLSNIIIDKRIDVNDLLVGDKNMLIVAARITGYGEIYDTNVNCPVCGLASQYSFDLTDAEVNHGGVHDAPGVVETEDGTFKFVLPKAKVEVEVRFLNGNDEKKLNHLAEKKKKYNLGETIYTDQLRASIVAVNGNADIAVVGSFVENMPALDSRHYRSTMSKITPNINMSQIFNCQNCGHESDMEVPFTADFFWPK